MSSDLQPTIDALTVERVLLQGDLQRLTSSQKVSYYKSVCDSIGLNYLTQPLAYLILNNKETLYAKREATEQLRKIHHVSLTIMAREVVEDTYLVTARATLPDGRTDESIGAKSIGNLKGEARANAMMTAETKAKRRVTLSICGLGLLDETEVVGIPGGSVSPLSLDEQKRLEELPAGPPPDDPYYPELAAHMQPAPADDLPPGYVRIVDIRESPTKNPSVTKFYITLSNGIEVSTVNQWIASLAQNYRDDRTPVKPTIAKTKYGDELKALATADTPHDPEPMPIDADIPF